MTYTVWCSCGRSDTGITAAEADVFVRVHGPHKIYRMVKDDWLIEKMHAEVEQVLRGSYQ